MRALRNRAFGWGTVLIILGVLLGYPLIMLLLQAVFPGLQVGGSGALTPSFQAFVTFIHDPLSLSAMAHTAVLALSVATLATIAGTLLMVLFHRRPPPMAAALAHVDLGAVSGAILCHRRRVRLDGNA